MQATKKKNEIEMKSGQMFTTQYCKLYKIKIVHGPVPPQTGTGSMLKAETQALCYIAQLQILFESSASWRSILVHPPLWMSSEESVYV